MTLRARIVLLAAQGLQNKDIAQPLGVGRLQVARWRERDLQHPKDGLSAGHSAASRSRATQSSSRNWKTSWAPTSASWLNRVERFFRDISENRLRRGGFKSLPELVTAIDDHVAHHNTDPKPFIWTKSARDILQKVIRANARLSSKQNGALHWVDARRFHPAQSIDSLNRQGTGTGCGARLQLRHCSACAKSACKSATDS